MSVNTHLQLAQGTSSAVDGYTGLSGELTYDTDTKVVRVHDGSTAGGKKLANSESLATVATSGSYNDLKNKPTIPTKISQLTNDSGLGVGSVKSINGASPDASGNVTISLDFLPIAGGTLTGNLTAPNITVTGSASVGSAVTAQAFNSSCSNGHVEFYASGNSAGYYLDSHPGTTTWYQIITAKGGQTISGTLYATGFQISSDKRYKSDLKKIDSALDKIDALAGYTYLFKGLPDRQAGVIAQEVEKVLPEAIGTNDEGYKTVSYASLVALCIEGIKELRKEINDLKLQN